MSHTQVTANYHGLQVHVDEGMKPLLEMLWDMDIETSFSCQGFDDSPAYILFPDDCDFERFKSRFWVHDIPYETDYLAGGVRVTFASADLAKLTGAWA